MVVDHLAHEGFKKTQVVKALESLAETKKVHYKVTCYRRKLLAYAPVCTAGRI